MHDELWAGVSAKLEYALFHFEKMFRALQPPEQTAHYVAMVSAGAIVDTGWQRAFPAYFDAFLSATHSVPEIIQCCFGHDSYRLLKPWFRSLTADEQDRRQRFSREFAPHHDAFRKLAPSAARNFSVHRRGFPQYEVRVTGSLGTVFVGTALSPVPLSESRQFDDPTHQALFGKPRAIDPPLWSDFEIDGRPLYQECESYRECAGDLLAKARDIAERIHANAPLTLPPPN